MAWGGKTDLDSWLEDVVNYLGRNGREWLCSVQWLILISGDQETYIHMGGALTCEGQGGKQREEKEPTP